MPDVFLSYSRDDQPTARRFAEALKREGFSVWWDQALDAGESFDKVTEQALKDAKAVVVLWSKKAVDSRWVRSEATLADRYGTLVPVTIESCNRPIMFELTHTADLANWNGEDGDPRWRAFIEGLRRTVGKAASSPVLTKSQAATELAAASRPRPRTAIAWAVSVLAVVLAATLFWYFQGGEAKPPSTATKDPAAVASIAVLPFRDMSQNKDQEYFADGVTEEILNTLASLKDLKVTARTSAFAFKGKDVDLRTVGETLGVQHILEGSIRKSGDTLRVTAKLIDIRSDRQIWSKTYDRPLTDIFNVQEDIARSVAEALQVALGVGFGKQAGMTRDVEAYDAYLASDPLRLQYNTDSQLRAIALLEKAVALDPDFGEAWANLAGAYGGMTALAAEAAIEGWQQKAELAFENAQRLAPESLALIWELAQRSTNQNRWTQAGAHYKDFTSSVAGNGISGVDPRGRFLLMVGRTREALPVLEQERARDPLNPAPTLFMAVAYSTLRNFPAAIAQLERGSQLDPSWQFLFQVSALSNALATRDRAEIVRLLDTQKVGINYEMRSLLDRPPEALRYLRQQLRDPSTSSVSLNAMSQWFAYFGDSTSALEALRFAFERGAAGPASGCSWYPVMRDVRRLPEFKQLMRDVGMVDYWREYGWGDFCKPVGTDDFECQ